jgi:Ssp1 endopeptidase immunity protein Rap1a
MKLMLLGMLMALAITPANAAEDTPANAAEDPTTAGYMLPHCKASLQYPPGTFIEGFCAGIVVGMVAVAQPLFAPKQSRAAERCVDIPKNVSSRQLVEAVVRYIEARPQRMPEQFQVLAVQALFDTWPCNN